MKKILMIYLIAVLLPGCATLVNQERQLVFFKGGQEKAMTKVQTPDGTFDIENGSGSFMMTRSRSDIPIKIMCSNGESKSEIIQTRFDWLLGGAGNLLLSGWGWLVDPFMPDAYIIPDVSLMGKCKDAQAPAVAH